MDGINLFLDNNNKIYYAFGDYRCDVCKRFISNEMIIYINWARPKSKQYSEIHFLCEEHKDKIQEKTEQTLVITCLVVQEINDNWIRYMPTPSDLIEKSGGISVFQAAEMEYKGVTIDNTIYANRSNEMERLKFDKELEDKKKELQEEDKKKNRLLNSREEVSSFLKELREAKPD